MTRFEEILILQRHKLGRMRIFDHKQDHQDCSGFQYGDLDVTKMQPHAQYNSKTFYPKTFVSSRNPISSTYACHWRMAEWSFSFRRIVLGYASTGCQQGKHDQRILLFFVTTMSFSPLIWQRIWLLTWSRRNAQSILRSFALPVTANLFSLTFVVKHPYVIAFNTMVLKRQARYPSFDALRSSTLL